MCFIHNMIFLCYVWLVLDVWLVLVDSTLEGKSFQTSMYRKSYGNKGKNPEILEKEGPNYGEGYTCSWWYTCNQNTKVYLKNRPKVYLLLSKNVTQMCCGITQTCSKRYMS